MMMIDADAISLLRLGYEHNLKYHWKINVWILALESANEEDDKFELPV